MDLGVSSFLQCDQLYIFGTMKLLSSLVFTLLFLNGFAQTDTITIVSYNLLNFPEGRNDCGSNTVVPERYDTLRKILSYTQPDIFVACEIQNQSGADSILTRSLNVFGSSNYAKANFHLNSNSSDLHNMLYYNTDKLELLWQDYIPTSVRDIDHYVLYVLDPTLNQFYDTTFIEVFMCHLKAGSTTANQIERDQQTQALMNYIATRPIDRNIFVCGDLNTYRSSEACYQTLTNGFFGLNDPINTPGNWNSNGTFAAIHTQSTRSSVNLDCGSSGGLDDRFDHILVSDNVMSGSDSLKYLTNTYKAIGNDGNHYNTSLISPFSNSQYPDSIVRALYYMSDHLPVLLKTVVTYPTSNGLALYPILDAVNCAGGNDGSATIVPNQGQGPYTYQWDFLAGSQTTATATNLSSGTYCVQVTDNLGQVDSYCVFIPEPDSITVSAFITPENGTCNGVIHLLVSGGTGPYVITWNDSQNQTGQSAYNLCSGTYIATIVDNNGCSSNFTFNVGYASLEELSALVTIHPNPVSTVLSVDNPSGIFTKAVITSSIGKELIVSTNLKENSAIDVKGLSNGYYFLQLHSNQGIIVHRFLKK